MTITARADNRLVVLRVDHAPCRLTPANALLLAAQLIEAAREARLCERLGWSMQLYVRPREIATLEDDE